MARRLFALAAVLLAGCSTSVLAARPATPSERAAVEALRDAWHAAGRPVPECGPVDRLHVRELSDEDLQDRCGARWIAEVSGQTYRVASCVLVGQAHPWDPGRAIVYVDREAPPELVRAAVVHESAHVLLTCESGDPDRGHEDREVWDRIVPAATRAR